MKKLLVIVAFLVIGYKVLTIYEASNAKLDPQYPEPYIVVYGQKTDGNTVRLQTELRNQELRYHYVDVDGDRATNALLQRLRQAGLDGTNYVLPVVEVNARMRANPKMEWILETYRVDHAGKKL